jgi:pre-rRNA-processing protein IPI3
VTCLHLSPLSPVLLVGTSTSNTLVVSLPSLQLVRTIPSPVSNAGPISFVSTLLRPPDLVGRGDNHSSSSTKHDIGSGGGAGAGQDGEWPIRPVGPLGRAVVPRTDGQARQRSVLVKISPTTATEDATCLIEPGLLLPSSESTATSRGGLPFANTSASSTSTSTSSTLVAELEAENSRLKDQLARAIGLNDEMWKGFVDGALKFNNAAAGKEQS